MKLDCDPTTVYAALLENRYRGTIYRSDLANTSPLEHLSAFRACRRGRLRIRVSSSIQAVLAPAETHYLYFVAKADGSGGHNFSESLGEHYAAVAQYQRAKGH